MAKSKRHLKDKKRGTKSKRRTMKGGECPCKNRGLFSGGFGAASYQGGLDKYIQPLNSNVGGDPNNPTNMMSERFSPFVGGKKSRKYRRKRGMKGGNAFFPVPDALLGSSAGTNSTLGFGTLGGTIAAANSMKGVSP